ncbi:DUF4279 domain-containing protein [uncultured Microbacterium sp.]|uniref:DUF4279 domain-containing protein n=1 Tax=uncultured Microbacterium sp. TaxID=191216 RepID=UPI00342B5017
MIRAGRASLVVTSLERDPDLVTQHLGLSPTTVTRKGEASRSGRVRQHHTWAVDAGTFSNDDDDQTGTAALTALLEQCRVAFGRGGGSAGGLSRPDRVVRRLGLGTGWVRPDRRARRADRRAGCRPLRDS